MTGYKKLCTEFYNTDKPTAPQDALNFYLRYSKESAGPILEPMCGTGRFLVPLLEHGFDVDGTDASPEMLAACREKCTRCGLSPALHEQFLHLLEMPRQYGLVFIPSGSFNLVTDLAQVRESLRRIHAHMLSGAKFVFEAGQHRPQTSSSWPWGGRWVQRPDGAKLIVSWLGRYDADTHMAYNIHRYELVRDGELLVTEFNDFDLRHYELAELRELLEAADFTQVTTFKTYAQRPPDAADDDVVVECVKP